MPVSTPFGLARVLAADDETAAFRALRLALPPPLAAAHQRPGQVVKVRTPVGEGYLALASAPSPAGQVDLLVKRGGKVADAALTAAAPGGTLEISAPFGKGFPVEEAHGRDVLLFAAGSGIAPIRALVQHLVAHRESFGRVTLFYGQRHGADFAYQREHLGWERRGVRVVLCPTADDSAWRGVRGRVHEVASALSFGGGTTGDAVAFACGMTAMVEEVRATLARSGIPPDHVHANF
ncbi:MAG: oxidoreductase [Deltaproteobacteria bacterium]|nr:oxidoreductase [Deltaproteobacteria bacterium]